MKLSARSRRGVVVALAAVITLYLAYVGAVFAALRSGGLGRFTRDVEDFKLEASGGYSLWPGRLVLKDARLRFKDYNIEMAIEARELLLRVSLFPIFSKTIHIDEVVARDARYKMLHRVKDGQKNRERLAAFPDIGFARPKVYDSPRPPYQVPPYRIRVESIVANVLEVWILEYRALGNFQARGGFEVHENVTVLPSHAELQNAQLFLGRKKLSSDADCDLRAHLGPFPGKGALQEVLGETSAHVDCRMHLDDLSALQVYWVDSSFVLDGAGQVETKLRVASGQLQSSSARVTADLRRVGYDEALLSGAFDLESQVDAGGKAAIQGTFRAVEHPIGPLDVDELAFDVTVQQAKVWRPHLTTASVRVRDARVLDPKLLRQLGSEEAPALKLDQASLDFEYVAPGPEAGSFSLSTRGAVALFPQAKSSISCAYHSEVRCKTDGEALRCPGSEFGCAPLLASSDPKQTAKVTVKLRAEQLEFQHDSLRSEWLVSFDDPTEVLQMAVATDMWTQLGLELAPLGDVAGRLRVNHRDQTLAGTIDGLRSGAFVANAGFLLAEHFVSRWRIETPLGRFGVEQGLKKTTVTPFVDADWDTLAFSR